MSSAKLTLRQDNDLPQPAGIENHEHESNVDTLDESIPDEDAVLNLIQHILRCHLKENNSLKAATNFTQDLECNNLEDVQEQPQYDEHGQKIQRQGRQQ